MDLLDKLNEDIIYVILKFSTLEDVPNILTTLGAKLSYEERCKLKHSRSNPLTLFKQITDEPERFMAYMFNCRIILSGSRACGYFNPTLINPNSNWDFFCIPNLTPIAIFTGYLRSIGVEWIDTKINSRLVDSTDDRTGEDLGLVLHFRPIYGRLKRNSKVIHINLWIPYDQFRNPISCIMTFRSSIEQCFVSGFIAVSLYSRSTSRNKSLTWIDKDDIDMTPIMRYRGQSSMQKWINRSVEYITYENYIVSILNNKYFDFLHHIERRRRIGDRESTVIRLNKYITSFVPVNYSNLFIKQVLSSSWLENPYSTSSICTTLVNGINGIDCEILHNKISSSEDIKLLKTINTMTEKYMTVQSESRISEEEFQELNTLCVTTILSQASWLHWNLVNVFLGVEQGHNDVC